MSARMSATRSPMPLAPFQCSSPTHDVGHVVLGQRARAGAALPAAARRGAAGPKCPPSRATVPTATLLTN